MFQGRRTLCPFLLVIDQYFSQTVYQVSREPYEVSEPCIDQSKCQNYTTETAPLTPSSSSRQSGTAQELAVANNSDSIQTVQGCWLLEMAVSGLQFGVQGRLALDLHGLVWG